MTPTLAEDLAAACIRIHAALAALGDRPSAFQRPARAAHIDAVVRVRQELHAVPGLTSSAEDAGPDAPTADLHTRYASDSGTLTEACVVVVLCGPAFGSVSASIPVGPDVTPAAVLGVWNAAIIDAGKAEIGAHRDRLSAILGLVVFAVPADHLTPTEPA
jgi:hypothetical protein